MIASKAFKGLGLENTRGLSTLELPKAPALSTNLQMAEIAYALTRI